MTRGFLVAKREYMDPICNEGVAPIQAWCTEAWERRHELGQMRVAWRNARDTMVGCKRPWSRVRGPAAAAWASLSRLGWRFVAPFVMQSDLGVEYNVLQVSPKRMLRRLKEVASRWGWKKVFVGKGYGDEEAASMAARVHGEWHRTALHGMHDATPEERGAARAVMDGSAWTEPRCCQAGYIEFPLCKWCQLAVGTTKHRLFQRQTGGSGRKKFGEGTEGTGGRGG